MGSSKQVVPLRRVDGLRGTFTPSRAHISRPIDPCPSHTASTTLSRMAGGYAGAPVASFLKRARSTRRNGGLVSRDV